MYKTLRIIFTILAALCAVSFIFIGVFVGFLYALYAAGAGVVFFGIMLLFKAKQEEKKAALEKHPDFMTDDEKEKDENDR